MCLPFHNFLWISGNLQPFYIYVDICCFSPADIESTLDGLNRDQSNKINDLDEWKQKEKEYGDKITDDTKQLEKMTNKQSLLIKKVGIIEDGIRIKKRNELIHWTNR